MSEIGEIPEVIQLKDGDLPTREENESTANYLLRLQEAGKWIFHGSPFKDIQELEPKQAQDVSGDPESNEVAIYATSYVGVATQRAILPPRGEIKGEWEIVGGTNPEKPTEPLLEITENISLGKGVIYVLSREEFEQIGGGQWKCNSPASPLSEIPVDKTVYDQLGGKLVVKSARTQTEAKKLK